MNTKEARTYLFTYIASDINTTRATEISINDTDIRARSVSPYRGRDGYPVRSFDKFRASAMKTYGVCCIPECRNHTSIFIGYSGKAGGIVSPTNTGLNQTRGRTQNRYDKFFAQRQRRLARLNNASHNTTDIHTLANGRERSYINCGEASVRSIAESYGCSLNHLYLASIRSDRVDNSKRTRTQIEPPCAACLTWVGDAFDVENKRVNVADVLVKLNIK